MSEKEDTTTLEDFVAEADDVNGEAIPDTVRERVNEALERLNPALYGERDTEPAPRGPVTNATTGEGFETLGPAVSAADAGDELRVDAGETLPGGATVDVPDLTVRGDGTAPPTVDGDLAITADGVDLVGLAVADGTLTVEDATDVGVEDTVIEADTDADAGVVIDGGSDVRLVGNTVAGFGTGITAGSAPGVELSLNTVRDNDVGIRVVSEAADPLRSVSVGTADRDPSFNVIEENGTGIRVEDDGGSVDDDAETAELLRENAFENNGTDVVPAPGDPPVDTTPSVTATGTGAEIDVPNAVSRAVRADLPDLDVGDDDGIRLESLTVESEGTTVDVDTSVDADTLDEVTPVAEGSALDATGYFEVTATSAVDSAVLTVSVARERLPSPDRFSVCRFDADNGRWTALPVERRGATANKLFYTFRSPGFSTFATTTVENDPSERIPFLLELPDTVVRGRVESFGNRGVFIDGVRGDPAVVSVPEADPTAATVVEDAFTVANVGFDPTLVRVVVDAENVTPQRSFFGGPTSISLASPVLVGSGQSVSVDLGVTPPEPDDQLWARLVVPTLATADGEGQDLVPGNEIGLQSANIDPELLNTLEGASSTDDLVPQCTNDRRAPVMLAKDSTAPRNAGDRDWVPQGSFEGAGELPRSGVPYNRVEAVLRVEQSSDIEQDLVVEIPQVAPTPEGASASGQLVSIYDPDGTFDSKSPNGDDHFVYAGSFLGDADVFRFTIPAAELAEGPVERRFDLVFETLTPCDVGISDNVFDYLPGFGIGVEFGDADTDRRWQDIAGRSRVTATAGYYSTGESLSQQAQNTLEKAMDIFAKRVIDAAFPAPVQMYGQVYRATRAGGELVPAAIKIANNLDSLLSDTPITPDNILLDRIKRGVVKYDAPEGTESVPDALSAAADEIAGTGPTVYVSDDPPEPKGGITGQVVQNPDLSDDTAPVSGVEVTIIDDGTSLAATATGGGGTFIFTLPPGDYTLRFDPPDDIADDPRFESRTREVTVVAGSVAELDIEAFVELVDG